MPVRNCSSAGSHSDKPAPTFEADRKCPFVVPSADTADLGSGDSHSHSVEDLVYKAHNLEVEVESAEPKSLRYWDSQADSRDN